MQTSRRDFLRTAGTASAILAAGGGLLAATRQNSPSEMAGNRLFQKSAMISGEPGQNPKYKILWTWDYGVLWDETLYWQGKGSTGENQRRSHFLKDYMRMVDFCSVHGINGIVIWGALRAHDNGVEQFRELVKYGKQKGVRILPGVGVFSYGGVFFDPRKSTLFTEQFPATNPHFLPTWLNEHPELQAVGPDGKPYHVGMYSAIACPSRKENLEWFKRSFEWLFEEFQIEGAQIETGDYAICHCEECKKRRNVVEGSVLMIEDMVEPYTAAYEVAKKANPDAWVVCGTYSSFASPGKAEQPGQFFSALSGTQKKLLADSLPDDVILTWTMDKAVSFNPTQDWSEKVFLPSRNNIAGIHHGSQWANNGKDEWAVYQIGDMVKKSRASGVNGVLIFGEESPASPPNEANYLVFSEFSGLDGKNPGCDYTTFFANTLDPLYGGPEMSLEWRRIYVTAHFIRLDLKSMLPWAFETPMFHHTYHEIGRPGLFDEVVKMSSAEKRGELLRFAQEVHSISSKLSGEACRRWAWLENWLWRAEYLFQNPH